MKNKNYKVIEAPPRANNHINSLRGMGYTPSTAIADIVDNSISAQAKKISLQFDWNHSNCEVSILDDGCGMTSEELQEAMTFSVKSTEDRRAESDLGRFGLGLKSASLSQARVLEVYSKKYGSICGFSWDLNRLDAIADGKWYLFEIKEEECQGQFLGVQSDGTKVVWKDLDKWLTAGFGEAAFLDLIDDVERYLGLVFHRYIDNGLVININGKKVLTQNPFSSELIYYTSPTESIGSPTNPVLLKGYLFKHHDAVGLKSGLLIYRADRLLCFSSWLDLKVPRELTRGLVLISIDITNLSDTDWKIDISKSKAEVPVLYKARINRFLIVLSKKILAKVRSNNSFDGEDDGFWYRKDLNTNEYSINRGNEMIESFVNSITEDQRRHFYSILSSIEKSAPLVRFEDPSATGREDNEQTVPVTLSREGLREIRLHFLRLIKVKGLSLDEAKKRIKESRVFDGFEREVDLVSELVSKGLSE